MQVLRKMTGVSDIRHALSDSRHTVKAFEVRRDLPEAERRRDVGVPGLRGMTMQRKAGAIG